MTCLHSSSLLGLAFSRGVIVRRGLPSLPNATMGGFRAPSGKATRDFRRQFTSTSNLRSKLPLQDESLPNVQVSQPGARQASKPQTSELAAAQGGCAMCEKPNPEGPTPQYYYHRVGLGLCTALGMPKESITSDLRDLVICSPCYRWMTAHAPSHTQYTSTIPAPVSPGASATQIAPAKEEIPKGEISLHEVYRSLAAVRRGLIIDKSAARGSRARGRPFTSNSVAVLAQDSQCHTCTRLLSTVDRRVIRLSRAFPLTEEYRDKVICSPCYQHFEIRRIQQGRPSTAEGEAKAVAFRIATAPRKEKAKGADAHNVTPDLPSKRYALIVSPSGRAPNPMEDSNEQLAAKQGGCATCGSKTPGGRLSDTVACASWQTLSTALYHPEEEQPENPERQVICRSCYTWFKNQTRSRRNNSLPSDAGRSDSHWFYSLRSKLPLQELRERLIHERRMTVVNPAAKKPGGRFTPTAAYAAVQDGICHACTGPLDPARLSRLKTLLPLTAEHWDKVICHICAKSIRRRIVRYGQPPTPVDETSFVLARRPQVPSPGVQRVVGSTSEEHSIDARSDENGSRV